jgi:putative methyltransferase (TIGR04325 family)
LNSSFKRVGERILPPVVADFLRLLRNSTFQRKAVVEWEAVDNNDATWDLPSSGWMHPSIAEVERRRWSRIHTDIAAPNPFEAWRHNSIMTFAYVVSRLALRRNRLSILEWGGGVGTFYLYIRELFPTLNLEYFVKEVSQLCDIGKEVCPEIVFLSDDQKVLSRSYDLVFASGSVHYSRDVYGLVGNLCSVARESLIVTRLPVVESNDDFVVIQRPHHHGYMTEYPGWFVNRQKFVSHVERCGFVLIREFALEERPHVPNAPEQCRYVGFLFDRRPV